MRSRFFLRILFFVLVSAIAQNTQAAAATAGAGASEESSAKAPCYTISESATKLLQQSSVVITCGGTQASGIAISDHHFMTAAHCVSGFAVSKQPVHIMVPITDHPLKGLAANVVKVDGEPAPIITAQSTGHFRHIESNQVHFPEHTTFGEKEKGKPTAITPEVLKEKCDHELAYGVEDAIAFAATGVAQSWIQNTETGHTYQHNGVLGVDIAIIECMEPHGVAPIAMMTDAAPSATLFISGVAGRRYRADEGFAQYAGGVARARTGLIFVMKPEVYAQPFSSLAASAEHKEHRLWINRVPLKTLKNGLPLFEDNFSPGAPEGFGLITPGDSGAGAVVVQDGAPYLAGIASKGEIPNFARVIYDHLLQRIKAGEIDATTHNLLEIVKKDWRVIEALVDVRPLADWINSIIAAKK